MRDDIETNVNVIELVRLHPCLYDRTCCDYSNRSKLDKVWRQIAHQINESVETCRDRWKNIRGRYVKQMKKLRSGSAAKRKKPYYLAEHLKFLDLFIRSRAPKRNLQPQSPDIDEVHSDSEEESNSIQDLSDIDEETSRQDTVMPSQIGQDPLFTDTSALSTPEPDTSPESQSNYNRRKNKQTAIFSDVNTSLINYFKEREKHQNSVPSVSDPDEAFLKSVLPDMKNMTEIQKRNFKVGVLHLAGQILNQPVVTPPCILPQYSPITQVTYSTAPAYPTMTPSSPSLTPSSSRLPP